MNQQKQSQLQQQQLLIQQQQQLLQQQQQQQQSKRRTTTNKNNNKLSVSSRKRSHSSSSSTSSSGSPSTNLFSTASSSDSGSSSMTSVKSSLTTKKKRTSTNNNNDSNNIIIKTSGNGNGTDSSADSSNTSSSQLPSIATSSSTSFTSPGAQRSVPAFLNKLYNMVEDLSTNDLIRWSKDGTSFIVEKHEKFAKTVLPRFYKHNTFASFVRQLNMYDFHKVPHLQQGVLIAESEHEIWEFSNPHFQRGRPDLLVLVTRKRNRDRDTVDTENISLSTLVQDLAAIKKYQSTIGTDLQDLHRDNEILWQETLNAREKYQRHQEAIEKILQFLTAIFANDHLAISMNNADSLPKGLIEEAASLAGIPISKPDSSNNKIKSSSTSTPSSTAFATSSLSNILSSVLRLYSTNSPPPQPSTPSEPVVQHQRHNYKNDRHTSISSSSDSLQYPQSPQELNDDDESAPSLLDFSKTLNTATRSAQTITQDIDMLQVNIESLANNLGIDPSQFDDDMETDRCFQDNYSNMINSANSVDRAKLYAIAYSNADLDKKNYDMYDHNSKKQQQQQQQQMSNAANIMNSTNQFNFNLQNPPPGHYQHQQATTRPHIPLQLQQQQRPSSSSTSTNNNNNNNYNRNTAAPSSSSSYSTMQGYSTSSNDNRQNIKPPQPQPIQQTTTSNNMQHDMNNTSDGTYRQLLSSMNYSDSFGPNYPSSGGNETPSDYPPPSHRTYDNPQLNRNHHQQQQRSNSMNSYYNTTSNNNNTNATNTNNNTNGNLLSSGTTASEYNAMVNDYTDMMRPPYFNTATNAGENYHDA